MVLCSGKQFRSANLYVGVFDVQQNIAHTGIVTSASASLNIPVVGGWRGDGVT